MENKAVTFEESLARLQEIVTSLENNDIELQQAFSLFEEGLGLVDSCDKELKAFDEAMNQLLIKHEKKVESNE